MTDYPDRVRLSDATLKRSHKLPNAGYDLAVNGVVVAWISDSQYDTLFPPAPTAIDYDV